MAIAEHETQRWYSTPEVCRLTGVSYRQVDYWSRIGVIVPSVAARGSGSHRRWSADQLHEIIIVMRLRALGVPLDVAGVTVGRLRDCDGCVAIITADSVEVVDPADELRVLAEHGGAGVVVVPDLLGLDLD